MRTAPMLLAATLYLSVSACGSRDARALYTSVLRRCSNADQIGKQVRFFGPSNSVAPGAVWRAGENGGYRLRFTVDKLVSDATERGAIVQQGQVANCEGRSVTFRGGSAQVAAQGALQTVGGELSVGASNARTVIVSAEKWAWDQIQEVPFEQAVLREKAQGNVHATDLSVTPPQRLVLGRALRVEGLVVELAFTDTAVANLKARIPNGPVNQAGFEARWTANNTLQIRAPQQSYIAGEFYPWRETGFAADPPLLIVEAQRLPANAVLNTTAEMP